jgi:hypothetical protein
MKEQPCHMSHGAAAAALQRYSRKGIRRRFSLGPGGLFGKGPRLHRTATCQIGLGRFRFRHVALLYVVLEVDGPHERSVPAKVVTLLAWVGATSSSSVTNHEFMSSRSLKHSVSFNLSRFVFTGDSLMSRRMQNANKPAWSLRGFFDLAIVHAVRSHTPSNALVSRWMYLRVGRPSSTESVKKRSDSAMPLPKTVVPRPSLKMLPVLMVCPSRGVPSCSVSSICGSVSPEPEPEPPKMENGFDIPLYLLLKDSNYRCHAGQKSWLSPAPAPPDVLCNQSDAELPLLLMEQAPIDFTAADCA